MKLLVLLALAAALVYLFSPNLFSYRNGEAEAHAQIQKALQQTQPIEAELRKACLSGPSAWESTLSKIELPARGNKSPIQSSTLSRRKETARLQLVLDQIAGPSFPFSSNRIVIPAGSTLSFTANCKNKLFDWQIEAAGFNPQYLPAELRTRIKQQPAPPILQKLSFVERNGHSSCV